MMRSMMAGISGLRMHQIKMDVIGNNIANVNTTGFKSSRVTFKEVFSSTTSSASAPDQERGIGGTNPMQVGMGMALNSIDLQYTEGSVERTDNPLDVSIEGDGLFVTKDNTAAGYYFTRAGMFGIDKAGNLITASGAKVCGWQVRQATGDAIDADSFDTTLQVEPLNLYQDSHNGNKKIIAPQATSNVVFSGNINSSSDAGSTLAIPMSLFDSYGSEHPAEMTLEKVAGAVNTWAYTLTLDSNPAAPIQSGRITFATADTDTNADGKIDVEIGKVLSMTRDATAGTYDAATSIAIADKKLSTNIVLDAAAGNNIAVEFDFSKFTQYASADSAKVYDSNGYAAGELKDYSIGSDGIITGVYSNGKQQPLGMIALASFDNYQGLKKVGDSSFTQTANSGEFRAVAPDTIAGALVSNTLEMSNVDLSKEFTDMIITQRGFQSNSRIITTTDELLQELVNLKR